MFLFNHVKIRTLKEFTKKFVIVFINSYLRHITSDVITLLTETGVYVIIFILYTYIYLTQIFQILDISVFGVLKECTRDEMSFEEETATVKSIMKVYHDIK
jgi:hypothetical protein